MRAFTTALIMSVIMISVPAKADSTDVYQICYAKERAAKLDLEWAAAEHKAGRAGFGFFHNAFLKALEVTSNKWHDECVAEEKRKRDIR